MARKKRNPNGVEPVIGTPRQERPDADPASGGQSGDLQGLSDTESVDSESVRELVEEGQYFEAAVVSGVEDAPDADEGPVKTHQVPEDDVPPEYADTIPGEPQE